MKSNKNQIIKAIEKNGNILGCYDEAINKLNKRWLNEVIEGINFGDSTDVFVYINRRPYVVEISYVDNEVDFIMLSKAEYIDRYGSEFFEKE